MELRLTCVSGPSPIDQVLVASLPGAIVALDFGYERLCQLLGRRYGRVEFSSSQRYAAEVRAYLDGDLKALDALPCDGGGTEFQQRVWRALREIPAGETRSYAQLAVKIGKPKAPRAVGLANALNPISLIIPCHRVLGSSGALTGYGGGLERKRWLLAHERALNWPIQAVGRSGAAPLRRGV